MSFCPICLVSDFWCNTISPELEMAPLSSKITYVTVSTATIAQLKAWIKDINKAEGRKVLTVSGKSSDLKEKLLKYWGLDAGQGSAITEVAGPQTLNSKITEVQWEFLREIHTEWTSTLMQGQQFLLCSSPHSECTAAHAKLMLLSF